MFVNCDPFAHINKGGHKLVNLSLDDENFNRPHISIDATNNYLTKIDSHLIENYTNVEQFKLSYNLKLDFPNNGVFLYSYSLIYLSCNYCGVTEIYIDTFSMLPNLEVISLQYNKITKISRKSFERNLNLKSLQLDGNKLKTISTYIVADLPALNYLSLSNNPELTFVRMSAFLISESVTRFICNYCNITIIDEETFSRMEKLQVLYLLGNNVTYISSEAFISNRYLKIVHLNEDVMGIKYVYDEDTSISKAEIIENSTDESIEIFHDYFDFNSNLENEEHSCSNDSRQFKYFVVLSIVFTALLMFCCWNKNRLRYGQIVQTNFDEIKIFN